jgi:hypothetical protein
MNFNPKSKSFEINLLNIEMAYNSLIYSIRNIREMAGLPLDKYKKSGPLDPVDHAQKGILDAAKVLGIDMGAEWGDQLDVRP